jgi:ubiquinone/menaquinone biosynthesis C-methylase UbiE
MGGGRHKSLSRAQCWACAAALQTRLGAGAAPLARQRVQDPLLSSSVGYGGCPRGSAQRVRGRLNAIRRSHAVLAPSDFADILACPKCGGQLRETKSDELRCVRCDGSAIQRFGVLDFLHGQDTLVGALQARFDLRRDEEVAARYASDPELADRSLDMLAEERAGLTLERLPSHARGGRRRYARWFASIQPPVGPEAGLGILAKAEAAVASDQTELRGRYALEAGCGPGYHAPGFCERFQSVILLDCSLANLVLAQRVCAHARVSRIGLIRADIEQLPVRDGSMDFIHENGVIEHVADPTKMLSEAVRVRAPRGTFVCLSPNRYPITLEPHFRLPLFGLVPERIRRVLIPRTSGHVSEEGTDLLSLSALRRSFQDAGVQPDIFFLPPALATTVRDTPIRRLTKAALDQPVGSRLVLWLVNRLLLPVAPYHFAVVRGSAPRK